ncbi:unnamed protein product [Parnassius apollo]|uniref:(apollo) hypothetical protein n=1 Tax=Parnassius apollo TaxID=110799 RepID=A0A8S3WDQ2_PARAO|nr:unnamed protein product [Parnassius apollo]
MRRVKRHKVKEEQPETSTSIRDKEELDLTYYIHDRVELMHQVFSVLKAKELKAMAPRCVQYISINDLQELCMEELLGISSKRLCAILDGAEPPSDTESSSRSPSPEKLETISLDSISSDEEILSESSSKKKKHKHRHRRSKSKSKHRRKSSSDASENNEDRSKASRAGLTVLELLELQARARAIRAQLQQEQAADVTESASASAAHHTSDDEVEIKEEPPEVVEISSEDEKPNIEALQKEMAQMLQNSAEASTRETQTVTKKINDLIITVPQTKTTRKIKLNRNKPSASVSNASSGTSVVDKTNATQSTNKIDEKVSNKNSDNSKSNKTDKVHRLVVSEIVTDKSQSSEKICAVKEKPKKKQKKKEKEKGKNKEGSDHDEITLELSDSEKMDLLEDLDRKNYDNVSSSFTEDSESSSDSSEEEVESVKCAPKDKNVEVLKTVPKEDGTNSKSKEVVKNDKKYGKPISPSHENIQNKVGEISEISDTNEHQESKLDTCVEILPETQITNAQLGNKLDSNILSFPETQTTDAQVNKIDSNIETLPDTQTNKMIEVTTLEDIPLRNDASLQDVTKDLDNSTITEKIVNLQKDCSNLRESEADKVNPQKMEVDAVHAEDSKVNTEEEKNITDEKIEVDSNFKESTKQLSEGEISDHESSEVEASDLKPEIVCISDEETDSKKSHKKKKNKKQKKVKKEKKSKKSQDFRNGEDENFYKESNTKVDNSDVTTNTPHVSAEIDAESYIDDDVYEVLELSDESSCNDVEGTVLSKEPTAEEIEALSAKIDEIERVEVVTEEEIREHDRLQAQKEAEGEAENVSWKDRYLVSKKVIKVLSTSNILNAMRKKNKELKRKLEQSKNEKVATLSNIVERNIEVNLEEGSIEHYNTLEGSTKYVDPVREEKEIQDEMKEVTEGKITKEMKKDAKQLLKMYKKLLKYNDMNRQTNPLKKKKKKQKRNKEEKQKPETVPE